MENKFYTDDDFEQFLKDTTDNFRMYPSKKVWYSIYNDLHPSRKWPSLAVCLLLIVAILYVGVTNNDSINRSKRSLNGKNHFASGTESGNDQKELAKEKRTLSITGSGTDKENLFSSADQNGNSTGSGITDMLTQRDLSTYFFQDNSQVPAGNNVIITSASGYTDPVAATSSAKTSITSNTLAPVATNAAVITSEDETPLPTDLLAVNTPVEVNEKQNNNAAGTLSPNSLLKESLSKDEKEWIENYAYDHRSSISKFKSRGAIQYYVTPSVGFRFLTKNNDFEVPANQQTLVSANNQPNPSLDINDEVTQKSSINMEAGVAVLYSVSKRTRLKAGIQFNYTSYISFADRLKHPTQSYLLLNSSNGGYSLAARRSNYVNSITGDKSERLNNKTTQLSLPVGADFKLLGKDKLKWYAGATVQPSFTTGGQVYALSADIKNYVEQNDLLRKWNMAAGLETFVSYKTPSGIIINAGPQLRYQFLSTYKKQYSYTEKLYNVGIKLGLTKSF